MPLHQGTPAPRRNRRVRHLRPCLLPLEQRVVPSFAGITGVTFDSSGDIFVSYNSTGRSSTPQQSVAEIDSDGYLTSDDVFGTQGGSALPGALISVVGADSLPGISPSAGEILELQPNGQLFEFNPQTGAGSQYQNLPTFTPNESSVYDVQTATYTNLGSDISLAGATYGDFGVFDQSLVIAAESNNWDFVVELYFGSSSPVATILVASPVGGLSSAPQGVAVDTLGTVLTTMPDVPAGSTTGMDIPVGFNLSNDGSSSTPFVPNLGLTSAPSIDSGGIAVDSQNNFIVAAQSSSLYGGGPGIVHINSALTAFLADPNAYLSALPYGIACQTVNGTNYLSYTDAATNQRTDPNADNVTLATELPLFSGQATPAMLRSAYGINQISFTSPGGTSVAGDGSGQTIAIIEGGIDPTLEADLTTFDQFFNIPAPPTFQIVNEAGAQDDVETVAEESLDVEWAHAVAPGASIVVYDTATDPSTGLPTIQAIIAAMTQAAQTKGVSVVTLSYAETETGVGAAAEKAFDADFTTPGVTFLAAAGDYGAYGNGGNTVAVIYPAASPNVVAVGGTSIVIDPAGDYPGTGTSGEVAWGDGSSSGSDGGGGGGLSAVEAEPAWQTAVVPSSVDPNDARALPDVSIDSGAGQEYDVFTSTLSANSSVALDPTSSAVGWLGDAGTSAAAPIWAGLIAIADQGRALEGAAPLTGFDQTLPALYSLPSADFHDIVNGSNGYSAGPGYDLATGLGTPMANLLVPALAGYEIPSQMAIKTQPPSNVQAGSTFGLTVQVEDSLGNAASGGTVTVALNPNSFGATLGGTITATVTNGLATFKNLTLSEPGTDFTLSLSDSSFAGSLTTNAITVTQAANSTTIGLMESPASPSFGQPVTLDATVSVNSPGTGVPTGTVTFDDGSTPLGTVTLSNGSAEIQVTPAAAGAQTITISYSGDDNNQSSAGTFSLTVTQAAATLGLSNLSYTYDGSPHLASPTTSPGGLSGVAVTYLENGLAVASPTQAGTYTVTASLDNPDYTAPQVTGTLVINQATPTLTWADPADITTGTQLGSAQLDATATFNGEPLEGVPTYTPAAGQTLAAGDQTLTVSFAPIDSTDFKTVKLSVPIDVLPQSTPPPPPPPPPHAMIIGERPVFGRKHNKHGKPVGKAVLTGFTLDFNMALNATAVSNSGNYQLDMFATKTVKKKPERVAQPIRNFSVDYTPASDSVTIELAGGQSFPKGGQITVLPSVTKASDSVLSGTTVFTITPGGKTIVPSP